MSRKRNAVNSSGLEEPQPNAVSRFLGRHQALIEFLGLLAAVAVLVIYYQANQLTQRSLALNEQSLELNRKQMMSTYVPWLSITDLAFDVPNDRLTYNIRNDGNAPAFVNAMIEEFETSNPSITVRNQSPQTSPPVFIAPHQISQAATNPGKDASPIKVVRDAFYAGLVSIKLTLKYDDPFQRHFAITVTADPRGNGTDEIKLSRAEMSGLEQLR